MKRNHLLPFTLAAALLLPACGGTEDDVATEMQALAEDAGDASDASDNANSVASIPLLGLSGASDLTSGEAAAGAASNAGTFFKPAGCLTATRALHVVTYEFKGCTGPLGLVNVNGKVVATFTLNKAAGAVDVDVHSEGLTLNKTVVEQSGKGTITFNGALRTLTYKGGYKGTSPRGLALQHTSDYVVVYDSAVACWETNGSGSTTLGVRGVETTSVGYKRCAGFCPTAGTITATGKISRLSISVSYSPTAAVFTGVSGKTYAYKPLWCKRS